MGFPSISYSIILPKPLGDLLDIWAHVKLMVRLALFYLGLFDPSDPSPSWEDHGGRVPVLGPLSQSSSQITSKLVKKSLPIVQFADFIERSGAFKDDDDDDESVCTVCLSHLEGGHEIRELFNCLHVFHVGCLDKWVDQGHMTCPLCRSNLLPEEDVRKGSKNSWMVERISYLFGDDLMGDANCF